MKITKNHDDGTINFGELNYGDIFYSAENDGIYIRCSRIYDSDEKKPYNAVALANGLFRFFTGEEKVIKIENAELVIEF